MYSTSKSIRALHVVKTADGALWAARQAEVLASLGVEVHVALPVAGGGLVPFWHEIAAAVHPVDLDLSVKRPWEIPRLCAAARQLVDKVRPDIIHSHFVGTTLSLRLALGRASGIPRVFQVAGPLHLEHLAPRTAEIQCATSGDYWIGSSDCIVRHYLKAGVDPARVFLSYYGSPIRAGERTGYLRRRLGIDDNTKIVGNINLIYPPRRLLGQRVGLKCHEDVIDALGLIVREREDVVGVLIGSTFGTSDLRYERELQRRAENVGRGKILMPGYFDSAEVHAELARFRLRRTCADVRELRRRGRTPDGRRADGCQPGGRPARSCDRRCDGCYGAGSRSRGDRIRRAQDIEQSGALQANGGYGAAPRQVDVRRRTDCSGSCSNLPPHPSRRSSSRGLLRGIRLNRAANRRT